MTSRRVVGIVAVVVLALLAGCGGFTPGGGEPTATPTLTPAPVPGESTKLAEGVWRDRVDAAEVVENHRAALSGTSYTVTEHMQVGPPDNASFEQRIVASVAPGWEQFSVDDTISTARDGYLGRGTDVWWNGDRAFFRYAFSDGNQTYYAVDSKPSRRLYVAESFPNLVHSLSVTTVEQGPGESVIVGGSIDDTSLVPRMKDVWGIKNASMTIRIGADGVVDQMAIGYDANHHDDGRLRVRYSYRITDVGSTTVDPPTWHDEFEESNK